MDLWEASVRASHDFLKNDDIAFFKPLILNEYLKAVVLTGVRDVENRIVGFSGMAEGSLEMLFVHPEFFGRGIGLKLLRHAIEDHQITKVDVNEQNSMAIKFYLKNGFKIIGRSELDGTGKPYPVLHLELGL